MEGTNVPETSFGGRLAVSVAEAARLLGVSRSHLYRELEAGRFPHRRLGGRVLISRRVLEAWLEVDGEV